MASFAKTLSNQSSSDSTMLFNTKLPFLIPYLVISLIIGLIALSILYNLKKRGKITMSKTGLIVIPIATMLVLFFVLSYFFPIIILE